MKHVACNTKHETRNYKLKEQAANLLPQKLCCNMFGLRGYKSCGDFRLTLEITIGAAFKSKA